MDEKTEAVRREILKNVIERFNGRGKKTIVRIVKERGVYKNFVSDEEVWDLVKKFAEFHKLPLDEEEKTTTNQEAEVEEPETEETVAVDPEEGDDEFLAMLKDQRNKLSKRLLAINRVIDIYEQT